MSDPQQLIDLFNRGQLPLKYILEMLNIDANCPVCGINLIDHPDNHIGIEDHCVQVNDAEHIIWLVHQL